jgi:predicted dehydrogenase
MSSMNWGIIGPGSIARDFTNDLKLVPGEHRVTAVLSHREESAREFAEEFGVAGVYTNLEKFLADKSIQAVYIATPHPFHYEQALACLKKKIPVLCEKPMTINAEQCAELVAMSRLQNTFLMEGMWIRFLPSIQNAVSLIREGRIGKIVSVKASMCYKAPADPSSRYFDPTLGGGSLLDLGIYPVFLAYLMLGEPETIKAIGTLSEKGVDEACSVLLHYANGEQAILESSLLKQTDLPAEITGEKGVIKILDPWFEKSPGVELQEYNKEKVLYPTEWKGHGLQFEAMEFIRCVEEQQFESEYMSHGFSLGMMRVMDEIRKQINVTYEMYE